jgi:hypothetical protein
MYLFKFTILFVNGNPAIRFDVFLTILRILEINALVTQNGIHIAGTRRDTGHINLAKQQNKKILWECLQAENRSGFGPSRIGHKKAPRLQGFQFHR